MSLNFIQIKVTVGAFSLKERDVLVYWQEKELEWLPLMHFQQGFLKSSFRLKG